MVFDDSMWKNALLVMSSDFDWKKICMLLAQEDPAKLYDLAMTSISEEIPAKVDEEAIFKAELVAYLKAGEMIKAIKLYRWKTGASLKYSKEAIDKLRDEFGL